MIFEETLALIAGIAIGIGMAIPIGPVGIIAVQRTIARNRLAGLITGLGAVVVDGFIAIIGAFSVKIIYDFIIREEFALRLIGGCILIILGLTSIISKVKPRLEVKDSAITYIEYFLSAGFLTITNPLVTIVMFGLFTEIGLYIGIDRDIVAIYLVAGVVFGSILWWLFLTYIADIFGHKIKTEHIKSVNKWFGMIIAVLGMIMLIGLLFK
ncbi:MAG TPA: LysE family transporter [Candidatus Paceibacterota bacterium]